MTQMNADKKVNFGECELFLEKMSQDLCSGLRAVVWLIPSVVIDISLERKPPMDADEHR